MIRQSHMTPHGRNARVTARRGIDVHPSGTETLAAAAAGKLANEAELAGGNTIGATQEGLERWLGPVPRVWHCKISPRAVWWSGLVAIAA